MLEIHNILHENWMKPKCKCPWLHIIIPNFPIGVREAPGLSEITMNRIRTDWLNAMVRKVHDFYDA